MEKGDQLICTCCGRYHEHTPEDNAYFGEEPYPSDQGYGLCMDCVHTNEHAASYDQIKDIAEHGQYARLTWPDDDEDTYPLLVDMTTARAMVKVHDALSEDKRPKFEEWIRMDRAHFGAMVELTWKCIT